MYYLGTSMSEAFYSTSLKAVKFKPLWFKDKLNVDNLAMKETRSKLPSIELSTRVANRKANSYYRKKAFFSIIRGRR